MNTTAKYSHEPWNKGKLVGQKAPAELCVEQPTTEQKITKGVCQSVRH